MAEHVLWTLALAVATGGVGFLIASFLVGALSDALAHRGVDPELRAMIAVVVEPALRAVAVLTALAVLGVPVLPVVALLGVVAVLAGLGAKDALRDVVGGAWLLQSRPFRTGDRVRLAEVDGTVASHGWFAVRLIDADGSVHTLPNHVVVNAPIRVFASAPGSAGGA